MRRWLVALIVVALLAIPSSAFAEDKITQTVCHETEWTHVQLYYGWGPACHYGQNVRVVYTAHNDWCYTISGGDIEEMLVHDGRASVYDLAGNLIETRPFTATEYFFDTNSDVVTRHDYGPITWYQVSHNPWSPALEAYDYVWAISGVYIFHFWNQYGNAGYEWRSGHCQDRFPSQ